MQPNASHPLPLPGMDFPNKGKRALADAKLSQTNQSPKSSLLTVCFLNPRNIPHPLVPGQHWGQPGTGTPVLCPLLLASCLSTAVLLQVPASSSTFCPLTDTQPFCHLSGRHALSRSLSRLAGSSGIIIRKHTSAIALLFVLLKSASHSPFSADLHLQKVS